MKAISENPITDEQRAMMAVLLDAQQSFDDRLLAFNTLVLIQLNRVFDAWNKMQQAQCDD